MKLDKPLHTGVNIFESEATQVEIVRKIDDLGRLVIPKEMRGALDWNERDAITIKLDGKTGIKLEKAAPACFVCGAIEGLVKIGNANICGECREKLKDAQDGDTIEVEARELDEE